MSKPIYGVFAPSANEFLDWAQDNLRAEQSLNRTRVEIETSAATYKYFRTFEDVRGYTLEGVVLLKGFNKPTSSWGGLSILRCNMADK